MTWAKKRQVTYVSAVLFVVVLLGSVVFYKTTSTAPSCFDGQKNGDEGGVDCGGSCLQYCPNELSAPKVRFQRSFEVSPGVVHAVAYIEHNNPNAGVRRAGYTFRLFTEQNTLIAERKGETFIGGAGKTAIVEPLIQTKNIPVAYTRISFDEPLVWEKLDPALAQVVVKTDKTLLEQYPLGTRLTTVLQNTARYTFPALEVVALLHDQNDNTYTASVSRIDALKALSDKTVVFTWPQKIDPTLIKRIEIIPRINPFTVVPL